MRSQYLVTRATIRGTHVGYAWFLAESEAEAFINRQHPLAGAVFTIWRGEPERLADPDYKMTLIGSIER